MKAQRRPRACRSAAPSGTAAPQTFINKGINGRWRDVLTAADSAEYERLAVEKLGPDAAAWLANGSALARAEAA